MNFKQTICVGLTVLGLASVTSIEPAASSEYPDFPFGGGFWFGQSSYAPPAETYPPFRPYAPRHARVKPRQHVAHRPAFNPAIQITDPPPHASALAEELAAMQKQNPGALAIFLRDDTLRKSDTVVTDRGLLVFKGTQDRSASEDHATKDFVPITDAKSVPHRTELAAIQKVFIQHFELVRVTKLASAPSFGEQQAAPKPFETVEIRPIRRIEGVPAFR